MPATLSLLVSVFPDTPRAHDGDRRLGRTAGLGVAFGPAVGGVLLDHFGWVSICVVNVPITVIAFVARRRLIPSRVRPSHGV